MIALRGLLVSTLPDVPTEPTPVAQNRSALHGTEVLSWAAEHYGVLLYCALPSDVGILCVPKHSVTILMIMHVILILSLLSVSLIFFFFSLLGKKADVLERLYKFDKAVKKRQTQTK